MWTLLRPALLYPEKYNRILQTRMYNEPVMEPNCIIDGEVFRLCEYIKDKFYFVTLPQKIEPKNTQEHHFFSIDDELVYVNYYSDFGPLNLSMLYRYCMRVNSLLKYLYGGKKLVHYTSTNPQKRVNAAFLVASYAMIYCNMVPREAYRPLLREKGAAFRSFQDASIGNSPYVIRLVDVLDGVYRALRHGFFNFKDFDLEEYEYFESFDHGDMTWVLPNKFLSFCGPSIEEKWPYKRPETYIRYFKMNNVSTIIRLNRKKYYAKSFIDAGFNHFDLFFVDGSVPSQGILEKFLEICESATGAIAVHCKAGLGRTGTLIAAYIMKHYRMTAQEAIAWLRVCRPGSVIGRQQTWLEEMECWLWKVGENYRLVYHSDGDKIPYHSYGIYSTAFKRQRMQYVSSKDPNICGDEQMYLKSRVPHDNTLRCSKNFHNVVRQQGRGKEPCAKFFQGKMKCTEKKCQDDIDWQPMTVPISNYVQSGHYPRENSAERNCHSAWGNRRSTNVDTHNSAYDLSNSSNNCGYPNIKPMLVNKKYKDELTQGDRLNIIKGMRSRFGSNSVPRNLLGQCKQRKCGSTQLE